MFIQNNISVAWCVLWMCQRQFSIWQFCSLSWYPSLNDESNYYHQVCPRDVSTNIENQSALKPWQGWHSSISDLQGDCAECGLGWFVHPPDLLREERRVRGSSPHTGRSERSLPTPDESQVRKLGHPAASDARTVRRCPSPRLGHDLGLPVSLPLLFQ